MEIRTRVSGHGRNVGVLFPNGIYPTHLNKSLKTVCVCKYKKAKIGESYTALESRSRRSLSCWREGWGEPWLLRMSCDGDQGDMHGKLQPKDLERQGLKSAHGVGTAPGAPTATDVGFPRSDGH